MSVVAVGRPAARLGGLFSNWRDLWTAALPGVGLIAMLICLYAVEPQAFTHEGLALVLTSSTPLILAAMAQMCVISVGDIDLGIGAALGLVNVIAATWLTTNAIGGVLALLGIVAGYAALGTLVHVRQLPAIIVTLGASFIWLGLALLRLPQPGGLAPTWLVSWVYKDVPLVPLPIVIAVVIGIVGVLLFRRTRFGITVLALGGNARALEEAGRSALRVRAAAYALAGVFVVLAGLAVTANTSTGDPNGASGYTILTIAAVILGGARFSGGVIAPIGTVLGAITLGLVASVLTFLDVSSDWQFGIQGGLLILVLAGRILGRRSA